jgi:hypothetical protein
VPVRLVLASRAGEARLTADEAVPRCDGERGMGETIGSGGEGRSDRAVMIYNWRLEL